MSVYYSITEVLELNTIIKLPRLHIPHLSYLKQEILLFFYYSSCWLLMWQSENPDHIDEKRLSFIAGSRRARNLVCTPYLDFGGNLFCQNRSINPRKPIRSYFHANKRLRRDCTYERSSKVLHHWSVNAHLIDWKWKETVLRNTQFSLWCQKKSSDR